ncbi:MAG: hypothetical protein ABL862_00120 [Candidatus Nitrotoga sp.]
MCTLPDGDADFSTRWMMIKRASSFFGLQGRLSSCRLGHCIKTQTSRIDYLATAILEHPIRNENDFARHVDYIHFNPVKHGHVQRAVDWPHSTFHRYVRDGVYTHDWAVAMESAVLGYD